LENETAPLNNRGYDSLVNLENPKSAIKCFVPQILVRVVPYFVYRGIAKLMAGKCLKLVRIIRYAKALSSDSSAIGRGKMPGHRERLPLTSKELVAAAILDRIKNSL